MLQVGHKKSNCQAFKSFTEAQKAKGQSLAFVCFESSLIDVPVNSWWIDSGVSIHVANSLQGFRSKWKPSDTEINLFVGNGIKVDVQFIGLVELKLDSGFVLHLKNTIYVSSMRRNLISLSKLDDSGFLLILKMDFVIYLIILKLLAKLWNVMVYTV